MQSTKTSDATSASQMGLDALAFISKSWWPSVESQASPWHGFTKWVLRYTSDSSGSNAYQSLPLFVDRYRHWMHIDSQPVSTTFAVVFNLVVFLSLVKDIGAIPISSVLVDRFRHWASCAQLAAKYPADERNIRYKESWALQHAGPKSPRLRGGLSFSYRHQ